MGDLDRSATELARATRLPDIPSPWQTVGHNVLSDGTLAALVTDVDIAGEHQRINAALQASVAPDAPPRLEQLAEAGTAKILLFTINGWREGPTFRLETPYPRLDQFSDGRWLIVASRSRGESNARVLTSDGIVLDRLKLGDGIEHVAIDAKDRIWIGWFDEGIFGNDDWRVPGRQWPPSSNGIACFAADGTLSEIPAWPAGAGNVADCYALNAVGSGVWACPYMDFPLVRFVPGELARWWRSPIDGPTAIAVDGRHAILAGGYGEDASRVALVELTGNGHSDVARLLAKWTLPLRRVPPSDREWAPVWEHPDLLTGRGDMLHLVDSGVWYRWNVRDFASG